MHLAERDDCISCICGISLSCPAFNQYNNNNNVNNNDNDNDINKNMNDNPPAREGTRLWGTMFQTSGFSSLKDTYLWALTFQGSRC